MTRTLRLRSSGDDVKFLQERLNAQPTAQPLLTPNGKLGAKTRDRVKNTRAAMLQVQVLSDRLVSRNARTH